MMPGYTPNPIDPVDFILRTALAGIFLAAVWRLGVAFSSLR